MKRPITPTYTFTPGSSTLNLSGISGFDVRNLFGVIDLKTATIIYAPLPGFGYSALSGTTLTLQASMVGLSGADPLMIIYDDGGLPSPATIKASAVLSSVNDAVTVACDGMKIVQFRVPASSATGTAVFEATMDGTTWDAVNAKPKGGGLSVPGVTNGLAGAIQVFEMSNIAYLAMRLRTTVAWSSPVTILANAGDSAHLVRVENPAGDPLTIAQTGSVGTDRSNGARSLPVIGSPFASDAGLYSAYVLVKTIAANPTRSLIEVWNLSGADIVVLRDDGTAATGAAPVNPSILPLPGGDAAGRPGGYWRSTTFRGRLQIFAPALSAFVTAFED